MRKSFSQIIEAPADPILGLTTSFKEDPRTDKVNLGVGVYKDDAGNTPTLKAVLKAEQAMVEAPMSKSYLPIEGASRYLEGIKSLLFHDTQPVSASCQTPGGTGALRIGGEALVHLLGIDTIWLSNPTWGNHKAVFTACGLNLKEYAYYDASTHGMHDDCLNTLAQVPSDHAVLLHVCCHNPSGVDFTVEQWNTVLGIAKERGWVPFFDFAYQGFGTGVVEDAYPLRLFAEAGVPFFVANSFSKNVGLYNERTGGLTVVSDHASAIQSQLKTLIRRNYSNPPAHGAQIVSHIMNHPELKQVWLDELSSMRERILELRKSLSQALAQRMPDTDFSFIEQQKGMFSFSGLDANQVEQLRKEYGIYVVGGGRINIAGIQRAQLNYVADAIMAVMKNK